MKLLGKKRKARHRVRDFCLYVLLTAAFIGPVFYAAVANIGSDQIMRWFGFAFLTFFLFGFFVEASRPQWKLRSFWYWAGLFFCAHSGVFGFYMLRGANWSGSRLALVFIVEFALLTLFRARKYSDSSLKKL